MNRAIYMLPALTICLLFLASCNNQGPVELKGKRLGTFKAGVEKELNTGMYHQIRIGAYSIQTDKFSLVNMEWRYDNTEVWQWKNDTFESKSFFHPENCTNFCILLSNNKILTSYIRKDKYSSDTTMVLLEADTSKEDRLLNDFVPNYWNDEGAGAHDIAVSNNGLFLSYVSGYTRYQGGPWDNESMSPNRICIYDTAKDEFREVCVLTERDGLREGGSSYLNDIYVTDDGKLIGLAGRNWGTTLIDAQTGKLRWEVRPDNGYNMSQVAITTDGKRVFSGAPTGVLYEFDAADGRIIARHYLADLVGTRQQIGGFADLQMSSDGKWLSIVSGNLFLYNLATGQIDFVIDLPGWDNCAVFSPDSKKIATFSNGRVSTYEIPEVVADRKM